MRKIYFLGLIFITICLAISCKKEIVDSCNGKCTKVSLNGIVLDASTNTGIKNVEVKASYRKYKSTCYFCFSDPFETFASTRTDDLGRFTFEIDVIKADFNETYKYAVTVYTNASEEYITGNYETFYNYQEAFSNIALIKYKKTKLSIKYKRDSTDLFSSYSAYHTFYDNFNSINIEPNSQNTNFVKLYTQNISDSVVEVFTGANFWTKITGRKFTPQGTIVYKYDSVFCNVNAPNNIVIKY
jgi:hypothetical protein